MSRHERYDTRDRAFSNWHRYACDDDTSMVDVDGLEYCSVRGCARPLLLIETARDVGQDFKPTTAMRGLAAQANVPAVTLLWTPSDMFNADPPHCRCQATRRYQPGCDHGILSFRCQHVHPTRQRTWTTVEADQIARWIDNVHVGHRLQMHGKVA
jgi:hypothetical protein